MASKSLAPQRHPLDRRTGLDRRVVPAEHFTYASVCTDAGSRFMGVQKAVPEVGLEALVLFNDPKGSTLCVKASKFSLDAVREQLAISAERWAVADGRVA